MAEKEGRILKQCATERKKARVGRCLRSSFKEKRIRMAKWPSWIQGAGQVGAEEIEPKPVVAWKQRIRGV